MRVSFVVPHAGLLGGLRVVAQYAEGLRKRGHEVCVVAVPRGAPSRARRLWSRLRGRSAPVPRAPQGSFFDAMSVEHHVLSRHRPVRDADLPDADVVVATWWETAPWVAALSPRKGAKAYLVMDYGAHAGQPMEGVAASWRLPLAKIVISRWLGALVEEATGEPAVGLVPCAVDLEQFRAPPRGKQPRPTVGFMYSARPQKGADRVVEAIRLARARVPELAVVAFGPPPRETGPALPEGTEYFPAAPDEALPGIYARCDAWLFGSRREGFGLPILEAMACRTPVVAFPAGAAPELLEGGGGFLVPQDDAEAMASALVRIAEADEAAWQRLSDAGHATATGYTLEDATERFEEVLRRVAGASRPGAEPLRR